MMVKSSFLIFLCLFADQANADQYHYRDVLIGDRAAGLGGAYAGVSDDPSGMFYNPAGIVYSTENYLSLSVNAFASSTETYKNIVPGQDYTYTSSSLLPSFFGFLQSTGNARYGFFVAIPNSDNIDQNDSLTGLTSIADQGNIFQRRFYHKDVEYLFGPSYARELSERFSVGISLPVAIRSENVIDNQFAIYNAAASTTNQRWFFQESSRSTTSYAVQPKLGLQFMPKPSWAIGVAASYPINFAGSGKYSARSLITSSSSLPDGYVAHDINLDSGNIANARIPRVLQANLGVANFVTKRFLVSGEFDYASSDYAYNSSDVAAIPFSLRPTWNASLGAEWYLADSLALRIAAFTNRANTPRVDPSATNQAEHVDEYCGALGFSYYHGGTSLSFTGNYGHGSGSGQGVSATTSVQTVTRNTMNLLLSGTYQM